jgi:phosphoribosyl-AMP cyclohydrolase
MTIFDAASLKYDANGLIPAIAQQDGTGEVLMMAWMNKDAVIETLRSGHVTYWSRSRQEFWKKGLTSGNVQKLVSMRVDCDRDCLLVTVDQTGPACHTNRHNCFYMEIQGENEVEILSPIS